MRHFKNLQGNVITLHNCIDLDSKTVMGTDLKRKGANCIFSSLLECEKSGTYKDIYKSALYIDQAMSCRNMFK